MPHYYKDNFLVVMLALVTPTVTTSEQTWVRTDPRLIVGSSTGCLWASPPQRNPGFVSTSTPSPTWWQRHFLFHHWRQCLSPDDLPHNPKLTSLPTHKRIFNYQCLESQKGGWECLWHRHEQIPLHIIYTLSWPPPQWTLQRSWRLAMNLKKGAALYYKDYFLVVLLVLVMPTVTSSGCVRILVWLWDLQQVVFEPVLHKETQALPPPAPLPRPMRWQRHFLFHHLRCLPPEDFPHKPCLLKDPSHTMTETFPISSLETMPFRWRLIS